LDHEAVHERAVRLIEHAPSVDALAGAADPIRVPKPRNPRQPPKLYTVGHVYSDDGMGGSARH